MNDHYSKKAFASLMWVIAFLHGFIASAGFAIGSFIDPESRSFAILPGSIAVACIAGLIVQARESLRCHRISSSYFSPRTTRTNAP